MDLFILAIVILFILNFAVTAFIAKRDDLDSFQKRVQIFIVWLIPFIAAIGLWFFNKGHNEKSNKNTPYGGGENPNIVVGGGSSGDGGGSD